MASSVAIFHAFYCDGYIWPVASSSRAVVLQNNVPKQCVTVFVHIIHLNSEDNGVGPYSRQVPK